MKKGFALALAAMLLLILAACGGKTDPELASQPQQSPTTSTAPATTAPAATDSASVTDTPAAFVPAAAVPGQIKPAVDGTLIIGKADIAVVVNGISVPMPYSLKALEAAGVPADESRDAIELGAGDFFSANLYLDDNEDYLRILTRLKISSI